MLHRNSRWWTGLGPGPEGTRFAGATRPCLLHAHDWQCYIILPPAAGRAHHRRHVLCARVCVGDSWHRAGEVMEGGRGTLHLRPTRLLASTHQQSMLLDDMPLVFEPLRHSRPCSIAGRLLPCVRLLGTVLRAYRRNAMLGCQASQTSGQQRRQIRYTRKDQQEPACHHAGMRPKFSSKSARPECPTTCSMDAWWLGGGRAAGSTAI